MKLSSSARSHLTCAIISFALSLSPVQTRNHSQVCTVSYARIQGREALITHFMDARFVVDDPSVMPIVYTGVHEQRAVQPTCMQDYLRSRGLVAPRGAQAATDPGGGRAKQQVLGA